MHARGLRRGANPSLTACRELPALNCRNERAGTKPAPALAGAGHHAHQRPRAHDGRHPRRGHARVCRQGSGGCPHRRHRRGHAHQQAHDLLLLRQQGRAVRRGAGGGLPAHARHRGRAAPGRPAARGRAAQAGGVHGGLPGRAPGVHPPGDDGEHPPRGIPAQQRRHPEAQRAGHRRPEACARARPRGRCLPQRAGPGGRAHVHQRAVGLQRGQPLHLLADLPARRGHPRGADRRAGQGAASQSHMRAKPARTSAQ